MRPLLNTLFVTSEDIYLSLDGENVVANRENAVVARYPLHTLASIQSFSYKGASPALMGACCSHGISLSFCSPQGKFLARISGGANGNVFLRRTQYRMADDVTLSCRVARCMIFGKIYNARWCIERIKRDHSMRVDGEFLRQTSQKLKDLLPQVAAETNLDSLRGLEGAASTGIRQLTGIGSAYGAFPKHARVWEKDGSVREYDVTPEMAWKTTEETLKAYNGRHPRQTCIVAPGRMGLRPDETSSPFSSS